MAHHSPPSSPPLLDNDRSSSTLNSFDDPPSIVSIPSPLAVSGDVALIAWYISLFASPSSFILRESRCSLLDLFSIILFKPLFKNYFHCGTIFASNSKSFQDIIGTPQA